MKPQSFLRSVMVHKEITYKHWKKKALFTVFVLFATFFCSCAANSNEYNLQYYSIEDTKNIYVDNKEDLLALKELILTNETLFSEREENTQTISIRSSDLKNIDQYFDEKEFAALNDFFDKMGICLIERQGDAVYFVFRLNDNEKYSTYNIYYIPQNSNMTYFSQYYTELKEISDNWYENYEIK